jgi:hypothetical protein
MLNIEAIELEQSLIDRIARVIELTEKVNGNLGTLRSTQVVASIVEQWERESK